MMREYGDLAAEIISYVGGSQELEAARTMLEERYCGCYEDKEEWAKEMLVGSDLDELSDGLKRYFDYERYARDFELSGSIVTFQIDGEIHIFWTH